MKEVLKNGVGQIEEKKSKFIGYIFKIKNEEEAIEYINEVKKKHWDARHNCYAYVCGEKGELQRFSDDGEPQGTAGKPILEIINNEEINNCLIVVTRYFGGTLLGTGGLIRAYQAASKEGLANSQIAERVQGELIELSLDYNIFGKLQYYCTESNLPIVNIEYSENVTAGILIKNELIGIVEKKLLDMFSGEIPITDRRGVSYCIDSKGEIIML